MIETAALILILHSPMVIDGDTIVGNIESVPAVFGRKIPVRLAGIDTAEMHGKCVKEIALAQRAKKRVEELIGNATEVELRNPSRDMYFRIDADVVLDGVSINQTLIREGLAKPYFGGTKSSWCK